MNLSPRLLCFAAALGLVSGACSKKAEIKSSVTELEQSVAADAAAPTPAQPQPDAPSQSARADADALVKSAMAAAQANDYAGGVINLQAALQRPGMTADQVAAAQRAKQAMIAELQRRAVNGDQQALAQLKAIEKTRSQ